jgi:hypothetical protein
VAAGPPRLGRTGAPAGFIRFDTAAPATATSARNVSINRPVRGFS